jgi:hypothetical protein
MEFMTWATGVSLFLLLSGMQYKMPHYINILFPFFSILLASFLLELVKENRFRYLQILTYIQFVVMIILVFLVILLNAYCFPMKYPLLWIGFFILLAWAAYFIIKGENRLVRLIVPSAIIGISVNLLLNGNFYPSLLQYQPGNTLAQFVSQNGIDKNKVFYFGTPSRSYDFYTQRTNPALDTLEIQKMARTGNRFYIYVEKTLFKDLNNLPLKYTVLRQVPEFRVTLLNLDFLNPKTRPKTLNFVALIQIN